MSYTHLTCICIHGRLNAGFELFGHCHSRLATLSRTHTIDTDTYRPGRQVFSSKQGCQMAVATAE